MGISYSKIKSKANSLQNMKGSEYFVKPLYITASNDCFNYSKAMTVEDVKCDSCTFSLFSRLNS